MEQQCHSLLSFLHKKIPQITFKPFSKRVYVCVGASAVYAWLVFHWLLARQWHSPTTAPKHTHTLTETAHASVALRCNHSLSLYAPVLPGH